MIGALCARGSESRVTFLPSRGHYSHTSRSARWAQPDYVRSDDCTASLNEISLGNFKMRKIVELSSYTSSCTYEL